MKSNALFSFQSIQPLEKVVRLFKAKENHMYWSLHPSRPAKKTASCDFVLTTKLAISKVSEYLPKLLYPN